MEPLDLASLGDEWPPQMVEKVAKDLAAREGLRRRDPGLFASVTGALYRHDPIGINFGSNADEYDPEAGTVIPRLTGCASVEEVTNVLHEEFIRWFGADIAGNRARYGPLAQEVWRLWTESQAEPGRCRRNGESQTAPR
jgi:hypothetical protein